ncbi:exonuclease [Serratia phage phiMAM1]|uniref:Exonuclease n=2 Tax=Miltonvirus MAM1 TaxID=2169689 RepID=A0A249Y2D5_9CAUD|nr:exonuclease [Serratia phage phiMAM1]AFX93543.1 putative exonuclease [Serratia phage phiMAM1]ASZ78848.1 exonuclease [Serratia phage 2050H1]
MADLSTLRKLTDTKERHKTFQQYNLPFKELECVTTDNGRWYVSPNGVKLTSVTTMLGRTGDHTWLEAWREKLGAEAADAETQRCADRGEAVHLACELYLKNEPMQKCLDAAGDYVFLFLQLKPYLDKCTKIWAQEIPLFSERLGLAGRVDCIAVFNGVPAIIDFKTSNIMKTRSMIEDYSIQLCLYSAMFQEMFGKKIEKLVNVISNESSPLPTVIEFNRADIIPKMLDRVRLYHKMDEECGGIWVH